MKATKLPKPEFPTGPLDEARGWMDLGDLDAAADILATYENDVKLNVILPGLLLGLDLLLASGDFDGLKKRAHQLIETFHRHPDQWFGFDRLALGLWRHGRREESCQVRAAGAARLFQLGQEFYREGAVSKAGEFFRAAIRVDGSIEGAINENEVWRRVCRGEADAG